METKATLAQFILGYMKEHDLSARQLATLVGVSNTTINRALSDHPSTPSLEFLKKLAKATGQELTTLVLLAVPDTGDPDPGALVLASYIRLLPPDAQEQAETFILGLLTRAGRNQRVKDKGALGDGKAGDKGE